VCGAPVWRLRCFRANTQDTVGEIGERYGTGSGSDLVDSEVVAYKAPGRYRSLYRTNSPAVSHRSAPTLHSTEKFTERKIFDLPTRFCRRKATFTPVEKKYANRMAFFPSQPLYIMQGAVALCWDRAWRRMKPIARQRRQPCVLGRYPQPVFFFVSASSSGTGRGK
jgi:hypothetical protein